MLESSKFPIIKAGTLEERRYQREVAQVAMEQNTLVVLPTGLGKTAVALLVAAHYLSQSEGSQVLLLAPTRVLVHQHFDFFAKHLALPVEDIGVLTGEDPLEDRRQVWSRRVVCATPQVTLGEVEAKNCKLENFSLIVFDEVHRAIGNYAYSALASLFHEFRPSGRMLGMTASLPSDRAKIEEILSKLKITKIEMRDEKSEDVLPYVFKTDTQWIELELTPPLKGVQKLVRDALYARLQLLEDASLIKRSSYGSISLKDLLKLRSKVDQIQSSQLRNALFSSIRLFHALNLVETQSLSAFQSFMDRMLQRRRGYGMGELLNDPRIKEAQDKAKSALALGEEHPKLARLAGLVEQLKPGERAIIFASYRDTVNQIYAELTKKQFKAGFLIGKSGEGGQNQKKQLNALAQLREGVFDILVATQVGEEGLDVTDCNLVIFYDNVPSAVRFVQRKGRTGRHSQGRVCVLVTKDTRDETYYWMSRRRAGDAKKIASALISSRELKKAPMDRFMRNGADKEEMQAPLIYADTREIPELIDKLRYLGAMVEVKQLDFGDFVLSTEIVIERKTMEDFVKSIFDGRLFQQLKNMNEKYSRPLLIIEGEKKKVLGGISEAALYGALASALADFRVPIFFASNQEEVAAMIFHIARREQLDKKKEVRIREGRKPMTLAESQLYLASGLPGVSNVLADRLLTKMGSVERLFSAEELDLLKVEGIGEVLAKKIREVSSAKYIPPAGNEVRRLEERSTLEKFDARGELKPADAMSSAEALVASKNENIHGMVRKYKPDPALENIPPPPADD